MDNLLFQQYKKTYLYFQKYLLTLLKAEKITQQEYEQDTKQISGNYLTVKNRFFQSNEKQQVEPSQEIKKKDRTPGDEFTDYIKEMFDINN